MSTEVERFSFARVEVPMRVTWRSGLTREQAIRALEKARIRSEEEES